MATYTNALLVYSSGAATKIQSTDDLVIGGSVAIGGNLNVSGDIISTGAQNVLISDAFLDLSSGYTTATARPSGFSFNIAATGTARTVTAFTAGVVATSAPSLTCSVNVSSDFSQYDIIQISGAAKPQNNGLYIVSSVSTTTVTLYGTGGTAVPNYALFCQSQVTTDTGDTATVTKVDLAVLGVSDGSAIKDSAGAAIAVGKVVRAYYAGADVNDFNGTGASTGYIEVGAAAAAATLQSAYNAGNSITLTGSSDFDINVPTSGTAAITLDANAASNFTVAGGNLTLSTTTSGTLAASSAGAMDIDAATALQINSSGGTIGIGNDAVAQNINVGTGAAARTITIGNTTGASAVALNSGTGDVTASSTNGDIVLDLNTSGYVTAEKDFGTVSPGAFDTVLEADFTGVGGNNITVALTSSTSFVISLAGAAFTIQINGGTTTVGHIETAISGLSVSNVANNGSGLLRVTTSTPHGLATGNNVNITGVTDSGGSGANGDWEVTSVAATTFDLNNSNSTGYSYTSGGTVYNYTVYGIIAVKTSGTTATVLTSGDTFGATALAGGVGEGQIIAKRGTVTVTTGEGISGSGAGFVLDSPYVLTNDSFAAYVYGASQAVMLSPSSVVASASGSSANQIGITLNAANSGAGQGRITARAKSIINLETTGSGGQVSLQSGSSYIQVQQSGDLNINSGSQPINLNSSASDINLTSASGGRVVVAANGGVDINSAAGDILVGSGANNYNIEVGTGGTRTVEVGSNNSPVMLGTSSTANGAIGTYLPVASANSVTLGNILYLTNASGSPTAAKADGDGSGVLREIVGIALQDGPGSGTSDTKVVTVPGSITSVKFASVPAGDSDIGKPVYLSTTAGEATMTAPSTGRVYRIGILFDGTAVSGALYKVLYLPAFVADLS
jgi:hypothetical protein